MIQPCIAAFQCGMVEISDPITRVFKNDIDGVVKKLNPYFIILNGFLSCHINIKNLTNHFLYCILEGIMFSYLV
jgi:hypothetical protein